MTVSATVSGLGWPETEATGNGLAADDRPSIRSNLGWPEQSAGSGQANRPSVAAGGAAPASTTTNRVMADAVIPAPATWLRAVTATEIAAAASVMDTVEFDPPIAQQAAAALRAVEGRRTPLPAPTSTRTMVVANQKGGVGKTTTAVNLAAALALHGLRVLVIDLDPQGNASTALGIDHHADIPSVYDVLVDGTAMADVVAGVEGIERLHCVPATIDLAGAEIELVSVVARESRLQKSLTAYLAGLGDGGGYDYVLIDCPPSLGLLTVNALVGGDEVLIPIQCEYYALEGLRQLLKNIDLVRAHLNPSLAVTTILLTMYDGRTRLAAQVADEVRRHFGDTVLRTAIPRSVRVSEAPSYGQTVMTYDPGSSAALSYLEAAREIAERGAAPEGNSPATTRKGQ
jgi:chromosome partitioning protein